MPDKIIEIRNITKSDLDGEPIIELIGDIDGIRYIRRLTIKNALTEYDHIELFQKIRQYHLKSGSQISQRALAIMKAIQK